MQPKTFDINIFLDEIMAEMHMKNQPEKERLALKESMENQLNQRIMIAVSNNIEGAVIDGIMRSSQDETDADSIFAELIANSPSAQMAILKTLEEFKNQMLDAHKSLANAN